MAVIELNADWEQDVSELDAEALAAYKEQVLARIRALDKKEPRNMQSEAYEEWGEAHEALEDILDDILDREEEFSE